jgi:hypothetical protein
VNEAFWSGLAGLLGSSTRAIGCRAYPELRQWATSAPKGKAGAALGLGLIAAKERGLPFVSDLEGWLFGAATPGPAEQPQRRTSVGPNAIPPPRWGHRPLSSGVGPVAPRPDVRTVRR